MSCLGIINKWDFNSEITTDESGKTVGRKKTYAEGSGKFCKEMRLYAEYCDRLLQIGNGIAGLGKSFFSHEGFSGVHSLTCSARATLSAFRSVLTVEQLASGDFIERTAEGKIDWLGTVANVCFAVGRFFNTAVWFDKAKVINLGKHAKVVGGVVTGAFSAGIALFTLQQGRDFVEGVQNLRKLDKDTQRKEYEKQVWALKQKSCWVLCGLSDMVEMPAGMFAPPPVAAAAAVAAGSTWFIGQYLMA